MIFIKTTIISIKVHTIVNAIEAINKIGETEMMTRVNSQPFIKAIAIDMMNVEKYCIAFENLSPIPSRTLFTSLN